MNIDKPIKRKKGRPKLPKELSRTRSMHLRVSQDELKAIDLKARKEGLTPSLWLRKLIKQALRDQ